MMRRMFSFASALLALWMSAACTKSEPLVGQAGEEVIVPVSLRVAGEVAGTPVRDIPMAGGTRAVDDPESGNGAGTEIVNLWVLQYNGITDDAKLIGVPAYIEDYDNSDKNVKLVASSDDNTIVFIANTCDPSMLFPQGSTLATLKARVKTVSGQGDLFGAENVLATGVFPGNGDYHPMMNGVIRTRVSAGMEPIVCALRRNIARIDLNIKTTEDSGVSVETVELRSVPAISYYITSYDALPELFPASRSFKTLNFVTPAAKKDLGSGETAWCFYAPVNQRGTVENANQAYKNYFAQGGATYAFVRAHYMESGVEIPVTYTFYLGANLENDFNLRPNHKYVYDIEIRAKGDAMSDARIEDWGTVDYSSPERERSNCYILNPAPVDDYKRHFRIPVDRIDLFWGDNGYESMPNYRLENNVSWQAEVVWADFDYTIQGVETPKMSGKGAADYFEIAVPRNVSGNMVIGVRQPGKTDILWSWHLWIADYRPDEGAHFPVEPGVYIYPVTGGELHRYAGSAWESGIYADRFMMDRNVGALSGSFDGNRLGALYYQFGRKDPFPASGVSLYGSGSQTPKITVLAHNEVNGGQTVKYSVQNPLAFLTAGGGKHYWTYGDKYNPAGYNSAIVWQDPLALSTDGGLPKSIFDPCPPGWCLPRDGVWEDFRTNSAARPSTNVGGLERGFTGYYDLPGRAMRYWPYPESGDDTVTDEIEYPGAFYMHGDNGKLSNFNYEGYYWSSSPSNDTGALSMYFVEASGRGYLQTSRFSNRSHGFSVRCVRYLPGM